MTTGTESLGMRLLATAREHRSRLAIWIAGAEYSYEKLFGAACSLAAEIERTTAPGTVIGLTCQQSLSSYVGLLAALLSGRPYSPVNQVEPFERQKTMFDVVQPGVLIADEATLISAERHRDDRGGGLPIYMVEETAVVRQFPARIVPAVSIDDYASPANGDDSTYILFTSGTTGTPKGVRLLHRNILAFVDSISQIVPLTPEDRCTQLFSLSFDPSVHDMMMAWTAGASLWVMSREDAFDILAFVRRHELTSLYTVPVTASTAQRLGRLEPGAAPSLRYSMFIGEALPTSAAAAWQAACPQTEVWNMYGPTEATISITACKFDPNGSMADLPTVPIGPANPGQFAIVVDREGRPLPPDTEGELLLGGPQVCPGYTNNPAENEKRFFEGEIGDSGWQRWYRTGDVVLNCSKNGLVFKGRMDDQIKVGGYRIEMQEIEAVIRKAAGTPTVAAVPWRTNGVGGADAIVAFLCGSEVPHDEILRRCRDELPRPLVPRKLINMAEMPTNNSGKIDRKALRTNLN